MSGRGGPRPAAADREDVPRRVSDPSLRHGCDGTPPPRRGRALSPGRCDRRRLETGWGAPEHLWVLRAVRIDVLAPFLADGAVDIVTWGSSFSSLAAGRRWSLAGDAGGAIEVDSTWMHLGADARPARIGEGFEGYAEAAQGRVDVDEAHPPRRTRRDAHRVAASRDRRRSHGPCQQRRVLGGGRAAARRARARPFASAPRSARLPASDRPRRRRRARRDHPRTRLSPRSESATPSRRSSGSSRSSLSPISGARPLLSAHGRRGGSRAAHRLRRSAGSSPALPVPRAGRGAERPEQAPQPSRPASSRAFSLPSRRKARTTSTTPQCDAT